MRTFSQFWDERMIRAERSMVAISWPSGDGSDCCVAVETLANAVSCGGYHVQAKAGKVFIAS